MAKKVIKINTNTNKTKVKTSSPTSEAIKEWSDDNRARERHYKLEKGSTKSIYKIDSNPAPTPARAVETTSSVKPGKTTVSPMAKVRGRILGGGMGGMFGIKNR